MNPNCPYDYEEFCENLEAIAAAARENQHECIITDVTAEAYEQMLADVGCGKDASQVENARGLIQIKRQGLLSLETLLLEAAVAAGFAPTGPRQRK
jgi:hypothetical protein